MKVRSHLLVVLALITASIAPLCAQTLVGHYNFNQSSAPLTDQASSPADAFNVGSPGYNQPAIPGESFGATGSMNGSSYWGISSGAKYSSLVNDFTVMAWIKPTNINGVINHSTVIFGSSNSGNVGWAFGFQGAEQGATVGQPYYVNYGINVYDLGAGSTASLLANNTWVHVAITKSSTTGVSFYINGTLVGSVAGATESANSAGANNWFIGNGADLARQFVGGIDEVRIYNGVLDQTQIQGISAIPEPSTYAAIFGACALGVAVWRRRRAA